MKSLWSFILQKRVILIILISLTVIVGIAVVVFYIGRLAFSPEDVSFDIVAPKNVIAGQDLKFVIIYKNHTRVWLRDVYLIFHPPKYFEVGALHATPLQEWNIGNIAPGGEGSIEVQGKIFGSLNSVKYAHARLSFWPTGFNSPFEKWTSTTVFINLLPLTLDLDAPQEVTSGQELKYKLDWENVSDTAFKNIEIRLQYPEGFEFTTSSPLPSQENHTWKIPEISPRAKGSIKITGILKGDLEERKIVRAELGGVWDDQLVKYLEVSAATQISTFSLIISQLINGEDYYNANWGELLKFEIKYKNTADIGAKEAIIKCKLEGSPLDFSTLSPGRGSFDAQTNTIIWSASANPELKVLSPGEESKLSFSIKLKELPPVTKFSDKEFSISSQVLIDSPTIPIPPGKIRIVGTDELKIKVNSKLTLASKGFYQEETVDIVNFGPIPPKVGNTTTYTIHWYLTNLTNDLEEVVVEADILGSVNWQGLFLPANTSLTYNERTGKLLWDVGKLSANTGTLLPTKKVVFQLSVTPSLNQVGKEIILIERSCARAKDSFCDVDLSSWSEKISTSLPDDPSVGEKGGVVVD